jgi:hypothetical protein
VPSGQRVLFTRHSLASGETATGRLWLDVKRVYLELRPNLRRLYTQVPDAERALTVLAPLGFAALPGAPVQIGRDVCWTLLNDFGPGSIDGWLSDVVGRELASDEATVVDGAARRLVLDGRAVDLTPLELDLLRHLQRREGVAVTRDELLREVWGHQWTGASSNVVEAVVSSLRRKMGDRAAALETVRGIGYRLGPLD